MNREKRSLQTKLGYTLLICGLLLLAAVGSPFRASASPSYDSENLFGDKTVSVGNDNQDYELGMVFQAAVDGAVTGIRVYGVTGDSGAHRVTIWDSAGTAVYSATDLTYTGQNAWVDYPLTAPLSIEANETYTFAVSTGDTGKAYPYVANDLAAAGDNGNSLTWPANAGRIYVGLGTAPNVAVGSNYMRDLIFVPSEAPPALQRVNNAADAAQMRAALEASGLKLVLSDYNQLTDSGKTAAAEALLTDRPFADRAAVQAALDAAVQDELAAERGQALAALNAAQSEQELGTALADDELGLNLTRFEALDAARRSIVLQGMLAGRPSGGFADAAAVQSALDQGVASVSYDEESLFGAASASGNWDGVPFELGVRFSARVAGHITGVRVFGVTGESGDHTIRLWDDSDGSLIAGPYTFSFTGSNAWAVYELPAPLAMAAGKEYTVSVSTGTETRHYYPVLAHALASAGDNGSSLEWPANAGVFGQTAGERPATAVETNYMRDVVFVPDAASPALQAVNDAAAAADMQTALEAMQLNVPDYGGLDSADKLSAAQRVLDARPAAGFFHRSDVESVFAAAVQQLRSQRQAEAVQAVNDAADAAAFRTAIEAAPLALDLTAYDALSEAGKGEAAAAMLAAKPAGGYADAAAVQLALDDAVADVAAGHMNAAVQAVNAASDSAGMRQALAAADLGLDLSRYDALTPTQQDAVAQALIANRPAAGYADRDAIQQALDGRIFGDIQNHWAQPQLQSWIDSGILTGDDDALIHPDGAVTRSRFMGLLNLAIGSGEDAGLKFADLLPEAVDGTDWHPDRNLTREEALALVAKLDELDPNAADALGSFSDRADIDADLEPYVNAAIARHLLPHYEESDQLLPNSAVTLAESVVLLQNGLANSSKYFFPIGVWLQSTQNAAAYKALGVNLYVNLFDPMTNQDVTNLQNAGMKVITDLDRDSAFAGENVIYGDYLPPDEPDNAQPDGSGGYGPPVAPQTLIDEYARRKQERPNTPVYLGLGQGVAWPDWYGRGADTGNAAVYSQYAQAGDVLGFDVYPVNSTDEANGGPAGKLWYVAQGVDNLLGYSNGQKPVWADIETTNYESNPGHTPTAADVKAEVWMALVHGAKGITYFAHVLSPFNEAGLLADDAMSAAVSAVNRQIQQLAPVLNSPTVDGEVAVLSGNKDVPVDTMVKREGGATYVFAVGMRDGSTTAKFFGLAGSEAEVIGEGRTIPIVNGRFSDDFAPYGVHLYRIPDSQPEGLSSLQIDGAAVTDWTPGVQFKQVEVPYSTDRVTIAADAADPQAEVSGTGEKLLQVGDNLVIVTAATDSGTATYVLNVRRQGVGEQVHRHRGRDNGHRGPGGR